VIIIVVKKIRLIQPRGHDEIRLGTDLNVGSGISILLWASTLTVDQR